MEHGRIKEGYRYHGQPLTPASIKELIIELFNGKVVERRIIVEEVLRTHLERGGNKPRASDYPRSVKKALSELQDDGYAKNPSYGYWRIYSPEVLLTGEPEAHSVGPVTCTLEPDEDKPLAPDMTADVIVGDGTSAVYLYYLPSYRISAKERAEGRWPCKIGRTDSDPLTRIISQAATALPERPHIALIIKTPNPGAWESAIHGALSVRGLQIDDVPGSEWFLTSPDEVLEFVWFIDPNLAKIKND
jgi:hypothetical protein